MVKDTELKGEHFHGNNPDMMLDFPKPTKAEIDEMSYRKPITSYKEAEERMSEAAKGKPIYMDGSDVMSTPNADFVADKKNYLPGSEKNSD
jgi:hypothetical protein